MSLSSLVPPLRMTSVDDWDGSTTNALGLATVVPAGTAYPGANTQVPGGVEPGWCALQIRSQSSTAVGGGLTAVLALASSWNTPTSWTAWAGTTQAKASTRTAIR